MSIQPKVGRKICTKRDSFPSYERPHWAMQICVAILAGRTLSEPREFTSSQGPQQRKVSGSGEVRNAAHPNTGYNASRQVHRRKDRVRRTVVCGSGLPFSYDYIDLVPRCKSAQFCTKFKMTTRKTRKLKLDLGSRSHVPIGRANSTGRCNICSKSS
jgi:hypothetical protein